MGLTDFQKAKLPKWARDEFENLERERFVAVRALREWTDNQTPSSIFIDEYECTGDTEGTGPTSYRRYIQGHKITIVHNGVRLDIILRDEGIDLSWGDDKRGLFDTALIPRGYQQAYLKSKENMR